MLLLNREAWLTEMARQLERYFRGLKIAPYRVTCGWPCKRGLSLKARVVGECHALESSTGGFHEIFISPVLEKPLEVAGTLCHEMAHVAAGIKAGHKGEFLKVCKHVGLTKGKPTHVMPGETLNEKILRLIETQGPYPHKALSPTGRIILKPLTALNVRCTRCGCTARMTIKWIDVAGLPTCGCGGSMEAKVPGDSTKPDLEGED